jgi:hypothetical protein
MAPIHFRDARLHARHHIFGKITERSGNCIRVKVKRVFRGDLRARVDTGASRLRLPERRASNMGSTLYVKGSTVSRARYVERAVSGSEYRCRDCGQHKDAQNPRNPSERCHRTPARIHRVAVACRGGSRADYDRLVELSAVRARGVERRFWFSSPPGKSANRPRGICCLFAISLLLKPHRLRATAATVGGAAAAAVVAAPSLAASPGCRETVRRR